MSVFLQKSAAALAAVLIVGVSFTTIVATPQPGPQMALVSTPALA